MSNPLDVIKKLQLKDLSKPILILNAPKEYEEVVLAIEAEVHTEIKDESYSFVQVFGVRNEELKQLAIDTSSIVEESGLFWLCYPKKSSKQYKGSDCSRDTVTPMLAGQSFEPVRQVAIDDDWSALRFRPVDQIKTMTRKFAVTESGKKRTESK